MNELQLIDGCRKGDRAAQKELYDRYARKMMGVCCRYVNDKETAADLLQDGFVNVFTAINSYSGEGSFEGWIRKIIVNKALESICESRMCCVNLLSWIISQRALHLLKILPCRILLLLIL